jgi:hypothetical protein
LPIAILVPIRIRIENPQIFPSWESPYDSAKRENALRAAASHLVGRHRRTSGRVEIDADYGQQRVTYPGTLSWFAPETQVQADQWSKHARKLGQRV